MLAIAQMPPGVPVACVGVDGAKNAAVLAAKILDVVVIERYTRPEMGAVWSEQRKLDTWLAVELAVTEALADAGVVPAEDAAAVRDRAVVHRRGGQGAREGDRPRRGRLRRRGGRVGGRGRALGAPRAHLVGRARHRAGAAAVPGRDDPRRRARATTATRSSGGAREHEDTLCVGRTHGVHAEPTTFGVKLAGFAFEADRNLHRLERAVEATSVGALSGAVGTYAANGPGARGGGARPPRASRARTSRPRSWRATATPSCCRPSPRRAPGWSASPPRSATCSAPRCARSRSRSGRARRARRRCRTSATRSSPSASPASRGCCAATRRPGLENVALWHERDISHSSVERVALPDATILLDYAQHLAVRVVDGMTVHADRMRKNLDLTHGALFSQRALLALVESGQVARRRLPDRAGERPARLGDRARRSAICWPWRPRSWTSTRSSTPRPSCATRPRSLDAWTASRPSALKSGGR